jgi:D-alanyl-D-alanine carboxypeptidase
MEVDKPTVADLVSDDAAEAISASGDWGIQIGAFKIPDAARRATDDARKHLPDDLKRARSVVDERRVNGSRNAKMYQARLVGMTEAEARALCRQLKKKRVDCFTVPPPVPGMAGT